jgi:hypothetical protein
MKPSRIAEVIDELFGTRWPVFLWGPPGVGKSSLVHQVAASKKLRVIDIRAALLDPTDIRGIPALQDGRAVWCPPSFLPKEDDPKGVLFFDELNSAPPLVQASLYQLTLDRRVGEYRLPSGWRIIAAGNRAEDYSITYRMPAALSNRFIHLDFELDYMDWRSWAVENDIHPIVTAFLGVRRELLLDMRQPDRGFPTPRSWEIVSDALKQFDKPQDLADVLLGIVGEGASVEFLAFCDQAYHEELLKRVLASPATEPLPQTIGETYALISYIIARAKEKEVRTAAGVLLSRLNPELAVMLLYDVLKIAPNFAGDTGVQAFMKEHADLITV